MFIYFDTADTFECEECGTAWETEWQAEECAWEDEEAERLDRTCPHCGTEWLTARTAEECAASCWAENASDRT